MERFIFEGMYLDSPPAAQQESQDGHMSYAEARQQRLAEESMGVCV
jgi:hypothetical protein